MRQQEDKKKYYLAIYPGKIAQNQQWDEDDILFMDRSLEPQPPNTPSKKRKTQVGSALLSIGAPLPSPHASHNF